MPENPVAVEVHIPTRTARLYVDKLLDTMMEMHVHVGPTVFRIEGYEITADGLKLTGTLLATETATVGSDDPTVEDEIIDNMGDRP